MEKKTVDPTKRLRRTRRRRIADKPLAEAQRHVNIIYRAGKVEETRLKYIIGGMPDGMTDNRTRCRIQSRGSLCAIKHILRTAKESRRVLSAPQV